MIDLLKLQKKIYQNKVNKWFNVTNIFQEFCYTHEELSEAFHAYRKKLPDLWEEFADVVIYILWMAEILNINLKEEIINKIKKNEKRIYKKINWILQKVE